MVYMTIPIFCRTRNTFLQPRRKSAKWGKARIREKVQAVVTSYDGRQDTPEAAIKILEDRFAEGCLQLIL